MSTQKIKTGEETEVKMEVKVEVKRKRRTIPQGPKTIVHEQGELNSPLTPDLTPYYNFYCFNTELCVDLKTILRSDRKAKTNKDYTGVLTRDGEEHFTFIETQPTTARHNPQLFKGKYITITRWADGSLHPNFRPMPVWVQARPHLEGNKRHDGQSCCGKWGNKGQLSHLVEAICRDFQHAFRYTQVRRKNTNSFPSVSPMSTKEHHRHWQMS